MPHIDPAEAGEAPSGHLWDDLGFTVEEGIGSLSRAALTPAPEPDPQNVPGAMQERLYRQIDDGAVISYEFAPAGWTAKNGERRKQDWRAYHLKEQGETKRTRLPSMTTWLGDVLKKDLTRFGEKHGIYGTMEAIRRGLIDPTVNTDEDAVERVRAARLGADAARDRRADEGIDVHKLLETWGETSQLPDPDDYAPEIAGYVLGLRRFLEDFDPEPILIEALVASRTERFAGRMDLFARCRSEHMPTREPRVCDLKTQPNGALYSSAHAQSAGYALAHEECGGEESATPLLVVVDAQGGYGVMDSLCTPDGLRKGKEWYEVVTPIERACQKRNAGLRKAA